MQPTAVKTPGVYHLARKVIRKWEFSQQIVNTNNVSQTAVYRLLKRQLGGQSGTQHKTLVLREHKKLLAWHTA